MADERDTASGITHSDRVRLESLRYATVPEAAEYIAIAGASCAGHRA